VPELPDEPDVPLVPALPDVPDVPLVPALPEEPDVPLVPELPSDISSFKTVFKSSKVMLYVVPESTTTVIPDKLGVTIDGNCDIFFDPIFINILIK